MVIFNFRELMALPKNFDQRITNIKVACTSGLLKLLIFSRKLFLRKFRAYFHETSDTPFPKINRDLEVPFSFFKLKPCKKN